MSRLRLAVVVAAVLAAAPRAGHANGRFPATVEIDFKPGDHDVMALQVTWGLLVTSDGGATWHWICEDAVGFGGVYDPDYEITANGAIWATTTSTRGLAYTTDRCDWSAAPAPLGGDPALFISQVEYGPDGNLYAAAATFDNSQIYVSTDDGASFQPVSNPGGGVDWWQSMKVAPSLLTGGEARIYLTGYSFLPVPGGNGLLKQRYFYRSDDSGASFSRLSTTGFQFKKSHLTELEIAAVSPADPDLVFAKVKRASGQGIGDDIWRSANGGASWTKVFSSGDDVTAVVVRQNGDVILAERLTGVHVSIDGGQTFGPALADSPEVLCMKERDDGLLFVCGKSFEPELMALGTSTDATTWTSIFTFDQVDDAYPTCADGSMQSFCYEERWCCIADQFDIADPACANQCQLIPPDAGAGPDAGDGPPPKKGCCSTGDPGGAAALALLVAISLLNRRRSAY